MSEQMELEGAKAVADVMPEITGAGLTWVQPDCQPTRRDVVGMWRRFRGQGVEIQEGKCGVCGRSLPAHQRMCERAAAFDLDLTERQALREMEFEKQMPILYRQIRHADAERFPGVDWEAWGKVMAHCRCFAKRRFPGKMGMTLYGETGSGKSTALWHAAHALVQDGHRVKVLKPGEFTQEFFHALGRRDVEWWLADLTSWPVLCMDDLGKDVSAEGVSSALFSLINDRVERMLPTFITTRFTGDELARRLGANDPTIGEDIARRLRDYTSPVRFRTQAQRKGGE